MRFPRFKHPWVEKRRHSAIRRIGAILGLLGLVLMGSEPNAAEEIRTQVKTFGFEDIVMKAGELAGKSYEDTGRHIPDFLLKMSYDQWRDIRYRPEKTLWQDFDSNFRVQFFHPGFIYDRIVQINLVRAGEIIPVVFAPDLFHYGMNDFKDKIPVELGFAGFRLRYPINSKDVHDEFMVFLGASYFRAVGRGQHYGLSARGLAINTGTDAGEEFAYFREFWIVRPEPGADTLVVYALLDSPSICGAYQFDISPGPCTAVDVKVRLFKRREAAKLGVAPLTSMFFYGENMNQRPIDDFRPEVHDSDGLLVANSSGEWVWRPLVNPEGLLVGSFQMKNPVGYGLFQRDQSFDHYQDLEARYDLRPSAWVIPGEEWGEGRVELIQIPLSREWNDNITCYWVPNEETRNRKELFFSYSIAWRSANRDYSPKGRVQSTRSVDVPEKEIRRFLIDFVGDDLNSLPADANLEAVVTVKGGEEAGHQIQRNSVTGGFRLMLDVGLPKKSTLEKVLPDARKTKTPMELRAFLRLGDEVLTETWSYMVETSP